MFGDPSAGCRRRPGSRSRRRRRARPRRGPRPDPDSDGMSHTGCRRALGRILERRRLAADDQQVVRGRVRAEPGAVVLEERAGQRQIQVIGEHRGGVELDVRAGRARRSATRSRPGGREGWSWPAGSAAVGQSVATLPPYGASAAEVVVGRVVLLDHDHDALDGSHLRHDPTDRRETGCCGLVAVASSRRRRRAPRAHAYDLGAGPRARVTFFAGRP